MGVLLILGVGTAVVGEVLGSCFGDVAWDVMGWDGLRWGEVGRGGLFWTLRTVSEPKSRRAVEQALHSTPSRYVAMDGGGDGDGGKGVD